MSTTGSQRCYVLLMRHAVPTTEGCADLEAVSRRLSETLRDLKRLPDHYHIKLKVLLHGKSTLASETAEVIATHFTETEAFSAIEPHEVFDGLHASPYSGDSFADELREAREAIGKHLAKAVEAEGNALLVVGHQPLIGILATQGIGDARSGWFQSTVPLAKSEVACFAVDRKGADGAIASCRLLGRSRRQTTSRWNNSARKWPQR
jgi:phosphohistidine phosphatase SixA